MTRGRRYKEKKYTNFLIFYMIFFILVFTSYTFSRYTTVMTPEASVQIAKPVIEIDTSSSQPIDNIIPGQSVEYYFNIKNTDNSNQKNEVLLSYYIEVNYKDNNLPLTYTIYNVTDGNELEMNKDQGKILLGYKDIETHRYKIIFTWPPEKKELSYANQQLQFNINVYAEQIISNS